MSLFSVSPDLPRIYDVITVKDGGYTSFHLNNRRKKNMKECLSAIVSISGIVTTISYLPFGEINHRNVTAHTDGDRLKKKQDTALITLSRCFVFSLNFQYF